MSREAAAPATRPAAFGELLLQWTMALVPGAAALVMDPGALLYVFSLPKRRVIFTLALLGVTSWLALRAGAPRRRLPTALWPLAAYAAAIVTAALASPYRWLVVWGWPQRYEGAVTSLAYLTICVVTAAAAARQPKGFRDRWRGALVASGMVVGTYGLLQFFGWEPLLTGLPPRRPYATLGNPVWLGAFLAAVVPIAIEGVAAGRRRAVRMTFGAALFIATLALLVSYTRSAWGGAGVGVAIVLFLLGRSPDAVARRAAATSLGVIALAVALFFWPQGPFQARPQAAVLNLRLAPGAVPEDPGTRQRLYIWRRVLRAIRERPWLGWGPDGVRIRVDRSDPDARRAFRELLRENQAFYIDRAHNEVLQVTAATGVLGLAAYAWLLTAAAKAIARALAGDAALRLRAAGTLGAVTGLFLALQFQPASLGVSPTFWSLLGLAFACGVPSPSRPTRDNAS